MFPNCPLGRPPMCVGGSEEALGAFFGALWPLGGASGRSFVAL